jgi:hypothetical protein
MIAGKSNSHVLHGVQVNGFKPVYDSDYVNG